MSGNAPMRGLPSREAERFAAYRGLILVYEGRSEEFAIRAPDISARGMFIHIPTFFPEGAVLKLEFVLTRSGHRVQARGEVRYCLPGVGIGVEFVDISPEDRQAIEDEVRTLMGG
jgi:hypothetical protein